MEQEYGIATRDFYMTTDIGMIAFKCAEKSSMHFAEDIIVEITNPETVKLVSPGEVGEVVVIPIDATYPLIRFGTGDLACMIDEPCPCGRTSLRLTRILERVGDTVRTRGMFVLPRQLELALVKFPGLHSIRRL